MEMALSWCQKEMVKLVSLPAAGENVYYFYSDTTVLIPNIHNVAILLVLYYTQHGPYLFIAT